MKNLLQKTALVVASLAVALGLAEAIVRLGGLAPAVVRLERDGYRLSDNTRLAYEPVPGFDGRNSMGFRDREHEAVKPDEVYRILVLGDSIAEGFGGIQAEAIFTARLQEKLDPAAKRVEVINFGVSGYNTLQEVELYRSRGRDLEPDLVILAYCLNDRAFVTSELLMLLLEAAEEEAVPRSQASRHLVWSHLYRLIRYRFLAGGSDDDRFRDYAARYDLLATDTVAQSFAELARLSGSDRGPEVLVVVFPQFGDPQRYPAVTDIRRYAYGSEHDYARSLARDEGFGFLDLLGAFQLCEASSPGGVAVDTYHPTEFGHLCAATAIAAHVRARYLGDGPVGSAALPGRPYSGSPRLGETYRPCKSHV